MRPIIWPSGEVGPIFIAVAMFDIILKAYALWHAARNSQKYWFIALVALNTLGILPIIYLLFFKPKQGTRSAAKKLTASRKRK